MLRILHNWIYVLKNKGHIEYTNSYVNEYHEKSCKEAHLLNYETHQACKNKAFYQLSDHPTFSNICSSGITWLHSEQEWNKEKFIFS